MSPPPLLMQQRHHLRSKCNILGQLRVRFSGKRQDSICLLLEVQKQLNQHQNKRIEGALAAQACFLCCFYFVLPLASVIFLNHGF